MSVAVVIPTHNRAQLVLRALRSVAAQTLAPQRVVVVDDGSTDGTPDRVHEEFPEVEVLSFEETRGVSAARNAGVTACRERWIAFLDSDDEWKPEKLQEQMAELELHRYQETSVEATLVHCDEIWIRCGNQVMQRRKHQKRGGRIFLDCLPMCAISPSAAVLRRTVFEELGGFDESYAACEDYELWLRWTARYGVLYVDQPLVVKYGGHDDQLSRRFPVMDRFRIRALVQLLCSAERVALADEEVGAALECLKSKVEIVANGAARRGRDEEAAELRGQLQQVQRQLLDQGVFA